MERVLSLDGTFFSKKALYKKAELFWFVVSENCITKNQKNVKTYPDIVRFLNLYKTHDYLIG